MENKNTAISDFFQEKPYTTSFQKKYPLSSLYNYLKKQRFDFDVVVTDDNGVTQPLQRGLVWSDAQKDGFIKHLCFGGEFPPICYYLYIDGETFSDIVKVIDGKQRLTTYIAYMENQFPINIEGIDVFYKDLPKNIQNTLDKVSIVGTCLTDEFAKNGNDIIRVPDSVLIDWFKKVNLLGTPQDIEHINKFKIN